MHWPAFALWCMSCAPSDAPILLQSSAARPTPWHVSGSAHLLLLLLRPNPNSNASPAAGRRCDVRLLTS